MSSSPRFQRPKGIGQLGRAGGLLAGAAGFVFGLSLSRILAEARFLSLRWLATLPGSCLSALLGAILLLLVWRWLDWRHHYSFASAAALMPLFLSGIYLFHDEVDLRRGVIWSLGGLLMTAVLIVLSPIEERSSERESWKKWGLTVLLLIVTLSIYLATLGRTVGRADTFEFQVVAGKLGIAHPTGYPLYLLLGKLFTLLPFGSMAFRVNLLSAASATVAVLLLYAVLQQLLKQSPRPVAGALAFLGALAFALAPTFWSQAVEAEVYALNNLFVAATLWLLLRMLAPQFGRQPSGQLVAVLFLILGLSLANHLTTVILFAPAGLTLLLWRPHLPWRRWLAALLLFAAGLALYLYLPLRWPAVHDGALMSGRQFLDWVIGGRFKGALQLGAWRNDPTRYGIVGRLLLDQWNWSGLVLALLGLLWLARTRWRVALVTAVAWLGYACYALSYYVPDISVFLIPAHLVTALWITSGVAALASLVRRLVPFRAVLLPLLLTLFALLPLSLAGEHWSVVDRSAPNPLETWGRRVLNLDLDPNAAVLADSEKIAPLYYLQEAEGLRPDLEIIVLPDEAAYRAELDTRLVAGQTVYLARFLPRLEGVYHLYSVPGAPGPLIQVSPEPLTQLPLLDHQLDLGFGPVVTLLGYQVESQELAYPDILDFTLYWMSSASVGGVYQVRLRLLDEVGQVVWKSDGAHPADDSYPTSAWRPGEIIPDAYQISWPLDLAPGDYKLQLALLQPYGSVGLNPAGEAGTWASIFSLKAASPREVPSPSQQRRIYLNETVITGLDLASSTRPGVDLSLTLHVAGAPTQVQLGWSGKALTTVDLQSPLTSLSRPPPARMANTI